MFILVNDMSSKGRPDYIWYICDLQYHENPNSYRVLDPTETLKKKDAIKFSKGKAERLIAILSEQEDEEGYSSKWAIEEVL